MPFAIPKCFRNEVVGTYRQYSKFLSIFKYGAVLD